MSRADSGSPVTEGVPEAIDAGVLDPRSAGHDVRSSLDSAAAEAGGLVPSLLGLSLGWVDEGVLFTVATTREDLALCDAAQYLDGGPAVEVLRHGRGLEAVLKGPATPWGTFASVARATGARGVLCLPLRGEGRTLGCLTWYAADPTAFDGRLAELTDLMDRWVLEAADATDLSRCTRWRGVERVTSLHDEGAVGRAVGLLVLRGHVDAGEATERIEVAASRAGIAPGRLAEALVAG